MNENAKANEFFNYFQSRTYEEFINDLDILEKAEFNEEFKHIIKKIITYKLCRMKDK